MGQHDADEQSHRPAYHSLRLVFWLPFCAASARSLYDLEIMANSVSPSSPAVKRGALLSSTWPGGLQYGA